MDPTFRFMTLDWDGRIRMDCSSPYAMQRLIAMRDRFDVAWACDTDHDRHGIVTRSAGLLQPESLPGASPSPTSSRTGRAGRRDAAVGKTVVSSSLIDRVAAPARPAARRGAGGLQVVRGRAARRRPSDSAERRARAPRSCAATARSGRPTRTASSSRCWRPR